MTQQERTQREQAAWGHLRLSLNGVLFPLTALYSVDQVITIRQECEEAFRRLHENLQSIENVKE